MRGGQAEKDRGWPVLAKIVAVAGAAVAILVVGLVLTLSGVPGVWRYFRLWGMLVALVYWPVAFLVLHRRYGERRSRREWERRRQSQSGASRVLFGYVMPFFAMFVVVLSLIDIGPTMQAAHGGGRVGRLQLTSKSCTPHHCSWYGTFRSDDGQVVRTDVLMHDAVPAAAQPGDEIRARDTGDRSGVFAIDGSRDWLWVTLGLIISGGYLIGWALWLIRRLGWRRRPAPVEIPGL